MTGQEELNRDGGGFRILVLKLKKCINQAKGVQAEEQEHHVQIPGLAECDREGVKRKSKRLSGLRRPY